MNLDDLNRMYSDTVIIYNGKPHKVSDINRDHKFKLWDLVNQRQVTAEFDLKKFSMPQRRLGMVNLNDGVMYVSRVPVRKFWHGLHVNNINARLINGDNHTSHKKALQELQTLTSVGLGQSLMNVYPTFLEAKEYVLEFYSTYAFDKQFAINTDQYVFYKDSIVGSWDRSAKGVEDIEWNHGKSHLLMLLNGKWKEQIKEAS